MRTKKRKANSQTSRPQPFLPRYQVLEKLGEGGVAIVYKVLDQKEGVEKALKALKVSHSADARAVERFEEEFRILRNLHHPSLPEVFDYGITESGLRFMVMEYVKGEALGRYFEKHKEELWLLLHQIVEALEFIHEHQLLHLDLKPGNILVRRTKAYGGGERPLITLIDFGLSYRREIGGGVSVVGTPGYMAPEIISGDERLTRAVDYYSLGVTIYELIEGRLPFQGTMNEVLRAHLSQEADFSSELVEYAEIYPRIKALMSKDARERLEAFEDFHRSLGARIGGELQVLERAYGMGYVESLGIIGKKDIWNRLQNWISGVSRELKERQEEMQLYHKGFTPKVLLEDKDYSMPKRASKRIETPLVEVKDKPGRKVGPSIDEIVPPSKRKTVAIDMSKHIRAHDQASPEDDSGLLHRGEKLGVLASLAPDLLSGESGDVERKIKEDLLSTVQQEVRARIEIKLRGPVKGYARVITLSGSGGSGKSFLLDALKGECLLRGISVVALGEVGDYEELVSEGGGSGISAGSMKGNGGSARTSGQKATSRSRTGSGRKARDSMGGIQRRGRSFAVDPRSIIIDRFVRGWERLKNMGDSGGVVIIADGFEGLSIEEKEFLEYIGKRLELVIDESKEPGIFIVVSGRRPRLRRELGETVPKGMILEDLVIPLPGHEDVENILARFHGHMSGVDDRKRLGEFLTKHTESSGSIVGALRESLIKGDLERESGKWRFVRRSLRAKKLEAERGDYYQILISGLEGKERYAVAWLCCHKGILDTEELSFVSGISRDDLREALEKIKPYRIVEVREEKGMECLGIVSELVREALYMGLTKEERADIHKRYLSYFEEKLSRLKACSGKRKSPDMREKRSLKREVYSDGGNAEELEHIYEMMSFHYECSGQIRLALVMRVKALRMLKRERDVFGIRRMCEDGIRFVKRLKGKQWRDRKWHLERYYIKEWMGAEWLVSNYSGLIEVVQMHIHRKNRSLPLGFVYKYGMALRSIGDFNECRDLLTCAKEVNISTSSESSLMIMLFEAALMNNLGQYAKSISLLNKILLKRDKLNRQALCKTYVYYLLNYQALGQHYFYKRYLSKVRNIAKNNGFYDDLLLANYYEILSLFNKSLYSLAKVRLVNTIKLASRLRLYYRLCVMYHLLSGIYFEEGSYKRALKYLDKSMDLAADIGMNKLINNGRLRHSFIYQNMGYYANAVHFAERAKNTSAKNYWQIDLFLSLIQLLYLEISINGTKLLSLKRLCAKYSKEIESKSEVAFYHYTLGHYYYNILNYSSAFEEYSRATKVYEEAGYKDDIMRSLLKMALICIEMKNYNEYNKLLKRIKSGLRKIESKYLIHEYYFLHLAYQYYRRINNKMMRYYLSRCESTLDEVYDIELYLKMSALIFRSNIRLGNLSKSKKYFNMYYRAFKKVISNLSSKEGIEQLLRTREFINITREFKLLLKRADV